MNHQKKSLRFVVSPVFAAYLGSAKSSAGTGMSEYIFIYNVYLWN